MILIADSGSTKTSWFFSKGKNHFEYIRTAGINPFFRTTEEIFAGLKKNLLPITGKGIRQIYFYGSGIINEEKSNVVANALQKLFPEASIEIGSDLLAAARATLGTNKGIACILGTGANSCFYNGETIEQNVPPLGFILGDEGSGAFLGKKILSDHLKGILPPNLSEQLKEQYPFSYAEMMDKVYKGEKPNMFLAQFVPFINKNISNRYCQQLVDESFNEFIKRNVLLYPACRKVEIHFVGSLAYYFEEQLRRVFNQNELKTGKIIKEPISGLVQYHLKG